MSHPTIIHHKAALDGQEALPNTLEAVANCLRANAAMIEIDICALATDDYLVMHDTTLDGETTGYGEIQACSVEAARQLKLVHHGTVSSYRPPLLSEVIQLFASTPSNAILQLDFKDAYPFVEEEPLHRLSKLITPLGKRAVVSSVADWQLRLLHRIAPEIRLGFDPQLYLDWRGKEDGMFPEKLGAYGYWDDYPIAAKRIWPIEKYLADRCAFLVQQVPSADMFFIRHSLITQSLKEGFNWAQALGNRGIALAAWTVDLPQSAEAAKQLIAAEVTHITTNTPSKLKVQN